MMHYASKCSKMQQNQDNEARGVLTNFGHKAGKVRQGTRQKERRWVRASASERGFSRS